MEPARAIKDADKCIELDPNFIKGYSRKGDAHILAKEYHKALEAFEKGLAIDSEDADCKKGYAKTIALI